MLLRHGQTRLACNGRLFKQRRTGPVFGRRADNRRLMLFGSKLRGIGSMLVVISGPRRTNAVKMHPLARVIAVDMRMRKRRHALQQYEQHQQQRTDYADQIHG
jgi:hypothetical protein